MVRASTKPKPKPSGRVAVEPDTPRLRLLKAPARGWRVPRPAGTTLQALSVFLTALALRLVHLWQLRASPLLEVHLGDAGGYHAWAERLAAGDWVGSEVFYQAPLYPYFLGVLYSMIGEGFGVRVVQALLGAVACVFLMLAGRRLFSPRVGLLAGLGLALFPTAIFFDGLMQKSVLANVLLCLLLWLLTRQKAQAERRAGWLWVGLVLGALMLTRENALVLLLPIGAWIALDQRIGRQSRAVAGLFLVAGMTLALGPVALRNLAIGGGFHLTTAQAGPNFYIGNHKGASGLYEPLRFGRGAVEYERRDATELAQEAEGRELTPGEVSRYWLGRAFGDISSDRGQWVALLARKAALVWNAVEVEDTEDQATYARWSAPLRLGDFFHFGWIAALAVLGAWITRDRWRSLWLFYGLILIYAGSVTLFFVLGRYRYTLVPMLLLFAAAGLANVAGWIRRGTRTEVVTGAALALGMVVFSGLPLYDAGASTVTTQINLGRELLDRGELEQASEHLEGALRAQGDHPLAHFNLGNVRQLQGRLDEAISHYRQSLAAQAQDAETWNNLGVALAASGDAQGAFESYRKAVALDPEHPEALNNLAGGLAMRGLVSAALENFDAAIRASPEYVDAHLNKARVLAAADRHEEALEVLESAMEVVPDTAEVHRLMAQLAERSGDLERSARHYATASELLPEDGDSRLGLGRVLASQGRMRQAVRPLREAARLQPTVATFNALAWVLASLPDAAPSETAEAVRWAQQANELTGGREPAILRVLAIAQSVDGDFEGAVATGERGLELAEAAGAEALARELRQHLELYRRDLPYRIDALP